MLTRASCLGRHLRSFVNRFVAKTAVFINFCMEQCNFKQNETITSLHKFLLT